MSVTDDHIVYVTAIMSNTLQITSLQQSYADQMLSHKQSLSIYLKSKGSVALVTHTQLHMHGYISLSDYISDEYRL